MTAKEKKELFVQAWKSVFGVETVNDDDNFFEVGGDSIKGVQLVGWLIQKGLKLDMLKIYTAPTVAELVEELEETQPMAVPAELLNKDNVDRFMKDPAVQQAMASMGMVPPVQGNTPPQAGYAPQMGYAPPVQLCTPPVGYTMPPQLCTPQVGYAPPQLCTPQVSYAMPPQLCTPQVSYAMPPQLCTPQVGYAMPPQLCTPQVSYAPPPQLCTPQVGYAPPVQLCTPPLCYAPPVQLCTPPAQAGVQLPYMGFPTNAPVANPVVIQVQKPKLGAVTRSPEDALHFVLSGIFPGGYNKEDSLLLQGMNSFQMMQLITRVGEQGYRLTIEDVVKNPTFSGIVRSMTTE